jgi:hypothetical protein
MELQQVTVDWILSVLINLIVPGAVWVTVIAGLILIVRDKVEEDDLVEHWPRSEPPTWEVDSDLQDKETIIRFCRINASLPGAWFGVEWVGDDFLGRSF